MLTATYCVASAVLGAAWWKWRRSLEPVPLSSCLRRALVCAYWTLAATMLGAAAASLAVATDDLSPFQFRILAGLVVGTVVQAALFAFVLTPVTMRGRFKNWTFVRALVVIECGVLIPSILLAGALLWMVGQGMSTF